MGFYKVGLLLFYIPWNFFFFFSLLGLHPAYLTYMQSTACQMLGWMKHKLESRTDAEAEAPILWSPDEKSRLIRKDPDAGKD